MIIWVTRWVFDKKQELITLRKHLWSPQFYGGVSISHVFSIQCCSILFCFSTFHHMFTTNMSCVSGLSFRNCPFDVLWLLCYIIIFYIKHMADKRIPKGQSKMDIQRNWQHRVHKTKKDTAKTQHNMCWTPLYGNKHK
jgi:hypothetical protein